LLYVSAVFGHLQVIIQFVKIATLYFQCYQDELFSKLKYFNVFHFRHPLIKSICLITSLVTFPCAAFPLRSLCFQFNIYFILFAFCLLSFVSPPIQCVLEALSPRAKRPGYEADHTPLSSADVKNGGVVPPLLIRLHGVTFN
jgi:hypothetical protein